MTLQGLWPTETEAKNFPAAMLLTRFSDVLAVTHSKNLTMWAEGQYATDELKQFAESGSPAALELELGKYVSRLVSEMTGRFCSSEMYSLAWIENVVSVRSVNSKMKGPLMITRNVLR